MNSTSGKRWNITKVNLWFDLAIFLAALLAPAVAFTGLAIHEWLGIGLALAVVGHLLLHWQWIVQTTKRLFGGTNWRARLNYAVNMLFFVDFTIIVLTGILISEVALPLFGVELSRTVAARPLHTLTSNVMVLILALHVGLHGKWIVSSANRYLLQPVLKSGRPHNSGKYSEPRTQVQPKEGMA